VTADFFEPQTGYMHGEHGFAGAPPSYGLNWVEAVFTHPVTGQEYGVGYGRQFWDDPWDEEVYLYTQEMWDEGFWTKTRTVTREGKWRPNGDDR
jgi:hypothetical protein